METPFDSSGRYALEAVLTVQEYRPLRACPFGDFVVWGPRIGWAGDHVRVRLVEANRAGRWVADVEVDARQVASTDNADVLASILRVMQ